MLLPFFTYCETFTLWHMDAVAQERVYAESQCVPTDMAVVSRSMHTEDRSVRDWERRWKEKILATSFSVGDTFWKELCLFGGLREQPQHKNIKSNPKWKHEEEEIKNRKKKSERERNEWKGGAEGGRIRKNQNVHEREHGRPAAVDLNF